MLMNSAELSRTMICHRHAVLFIMFCGVVFMLHTSDGCRKRRVFNIYGHNGTVYDCSGLGLTLLPRDLPRDAIWLDLSSNKIQSISGKDLPGSNILIKYSLGNNMITFLPRNAFLGFPNLRYLDVSYNKLRAVDNGTLSHLQFLRVLKLEHNKFSNGNIMKEIAHLHSLDTLTISMSGFLYFPKEFGSMKNLTNLYIDANSDISYNSSSFVSLSTLPVTYLYMSLSTYSICSDMNETVLIPFKRLQDFSLRRLCSVNSILQALKYFQNRTMQSLDFSENVYNLKRETILKDHDFRYLRNICVKRVIFYHAYIIDIQILDAWNESLFKKCIQRIDLSKNHISDSVFISRLLSLPNITYLNLNSSGQLSLEPHRYKSTSGDPDFNLTFSRSLQELDFSNSHMQPDLVDDRSLTIISVGLLKLNFCKTGFFWCNYANVKLLFPMLTSLDISEGTCKELYPMFFTPLVSLREFFVRNTDLSKGFDRDKDGVFLQGLSKLKLLDISKNDLEKLHPNLFSSQRNSLEILYLDLNHFRNIPISVKGISSLKLLSLVSNKFASFSRADVEILKSLDKVEVDLRGNQFDCSCKSLESLKVMKEIDRKFLHLNDTFCNGLPKRSLNDTLNTLHALEISCLSTTWLHFSAVFLSLTLLVLLVSSLCYRFRILLTYFLLRIRLFWRDSINSYQGEETHPFDAYISHSPSDISWVKSFLYENLSSANVSLCFHDKDFTPGNSICEEIVKHINQSKCIIFVITEHFLEHDWGTYEIQIAKIHTIKTDARILLILKDEIDIQNLPNEFLFIWWKIKLFQWFECDTDDKQKNFWRNMVREINN